MRTLRLAYPILLSTVPALFLAAHNTSEYSLADLGGILLLIVCVFAALLGLLALLLRGRASPHAAPTIATAAALWLWGFIPAQSWFRDTVSWRLGATAIVAPLGLVATALLVRWVLRRPERAENLTRVLSVMSLLLVGWSGVAVARDSLRAPAIVSRSAFAREIARPLPVDSSRLVPGAPRRDVYLIVMDYYPSSAILLEYYGFDNHVVEDSLRALGFVLPPVRSNYTHTMLSLPSLLNMRHVTRLADEMGVESYDPTLPFHLIDHNAAARFFKANGYRYELFPSSWWRGSSSSALADRVYEGTEPFDLRRRAARTDLRMTLWRSSILKLMGGPNAREDAGHLIRSFRTLAELPPPAQPTFTFAHFLVPHVPYLYDANCNVLPDPPDPTLPYGSPLDKERFVLHLQCGNKQLLRVVSALLAKSRTPPIILVIGDHGTRSSDPEPGVPDPSPHQLRERFNAFGAFYLPGGGPPQLHESVTLVNLLGLVLGHYFGAVVPAQPDEFYYTWGNHPYRFKAIDGRDLAGAEPAVH